MTGNCKKHGVTEFTLADANGNSVCRKCVQEWVQGWMVQGTLVALQDYLKAQETLPFSMGCHMDKSACSLCSDLPHDQHLAPKFHKGPEAVEFFAVSFVMAPKCAACGQTMKVAPGSQYRCVNGRGGVRCPEFNKPVFTGITPMPAEPTFKLFSGENNLPAIKCLKCGRISYSLNDIKFRYCGDCNEFHDEHSR